MEDQRAVNCFNCPEFNSLKGSCKRANKKLPCIKQEPLADVQPKKS
jgi:hypothetical protein